MKFENEVPFSSRCKMESSVEFWQLASWSHLFWKSRTEVNVSRSASVWLEVSQTKTLESLRIASQDDYASSPYLLPHCQRCEPFMVLCISEMSTTLVKLLMILWRMCKIDEGPCSHNKSFAHSACLRFPVNAPGSNMDNIFDILVFNIFAFVYIYELKACYFPVCTIATKMVKWE